MNVIIGLMELFAYWALLFVMMTDSFVKPIYWFMTHDFIRRG